MTNPVPGKRITTPYGKPGRLWKTGYHVGADYAAPTGTPIVAVKDGKVLESKNGTSWGAAYGISVVIDHGNGIRAIYAHMSKSDVKAGDKVEEGQKIGEVGSTGNSTGPHLHLETRVSPWRYNNKDIDPDALLNDGPRVSAKDSNKVAAPVKVAAPAKKAPAKKAPVKKAVAKKNQKKINYNEVISDLSNKRNKALANNNKTRAKNLYKKILEARMAKAKENKNILRVKMLQRKINNIK